MSLKLREAVVRRGAFRLSADFETPTDGVTVVFGPSGAGKCRTRAGSDGPTTTDGRPSP